jgi:hypothetical protein
VVSKVRVLLFMLALLVLAIAMIGLLAAVGASAIWFTILPIGILLFGSFFAQSSGWLNKKSED